MVMGTEQILQLTLDVVRRDGWKPNGWGLVPPWSIRRAINHVVENAFKWADERGEAGTAARQAISDALGQPLGLISVWEGQPGRCQQDVENLLEKAITGVHG